MAEEEVITENVEEAARLFLTTPFEEYTVTEGLLLALLILVFLYICGKVLKEGFYWLW